MTVINPGFMSVFVGTALLCLLIGIRSLFMWNQGAAKLALIASIVYLMGTFGVTVVFNVLLNRKLALTADPAQAIAFWPNYLSAWRLWDQVRTVAAAFSGVFFTLGLCRR